MKKILCISVALTFLVGLSAFAGGGQEKKDQGAAAKTPVELTIWQGDWWNEKAPLYKAAFEKANPDTR